MLVLHDEATQLHSTVELIGAKFIKALECPERIEVIVQAILSDGHHTIELIDSVNDIIEDGTRLIDGSTLKEVLSMTHDEGYLEHLRTVHSEWVANDIIKEDESVLPECFPVMGLSKPNTLSKPPRDPFAKSGYYAFDMSTGICRDTWISSCASANLAVEAALRVVAPEKPDQLPCRDVLALCRPPGHHCTTKLAGGYCYINNAVVTVQSLRHYLSSVTTVDYSPRPAESRILILDLDFHHGNGTQSYFYSDPSVFYVSVHGENEYPYYSGFEDEVGQGDGEGFNLNLPLATKSSVEEYLAKLETAIWKTQDFKPEYLIVSLGFDTFHLDPLGSFDLRAKDYETIARAVRGADVLKEIPSIILLEGGYVLKDLAENMLQFLKGWEAA